MRNNTKHWMASDLGEQASFFVNRTGRFTKSGVEIVQSYLQIKQVQSKDQGFYRCRVDFFQAPTRNVKVKLSLIGMYLFQEVGNPKLGFPNLEFIQLWIGRTPVGHKSFP